jgi:hypothetical protein
MDNNEMDALLTAWNSRTLSDLYRQAKEEINGTAFSCLRINGKRAVVVVCITEPDQIAFFERRFDLLTDTGLDDWASLTLRDVALRALGANTLLILPRKMAPRALSALGLIAADPSSIAALETLIDFP